MDYIKELMTGDQNEEYAHQKFVKYGKGTFEGPVMAIKKSGDSLKITGSYDYADAVAGMIIRNAAGKIKVSGNVYSRSGIKTEYAGKVKKKLGIVNTEIKAETEAPALKTLYEQNKDATFLIDIEGPGIKMKSKKKPPKPGSGLDDEFFSVTLPATMMDAVFVFLLFDAQKKDFKEAKVSHTYRINELVIPGEYKNDPVKARLMAKRKGTIKRVVEIDGQKTETEKEMLV